jgi:hypothetical protein
MVTGSVIHLQCDWETALKEPNGKAWVSCRTNGQPTLYGELRHVGTDSRDLPLIEASEDFSCTVISGVSAVIKCDARVLINIRVVLFP